MHRYGPAAILPALLAPIRVIEDATSMGRGLRATPVNPDLSCTASMCSSSGTRTQQTATTYPGRLTKSPGAKSTSMRSAANDRITPRTASSAPSRNGPSSPWTWRHHNSALGSEPRNHCWFSFRFCWREFRGVIVRTVIHLDSPQSENARLLRTKVDSMLSFL